MLDALGHDLVAACRHVWRARGFFSLAVVTLALGIGANAAMFSLLNAIVLRPLPIPEPERLVAISPRSPQDQIRAAPVPIVAEFTGEDSPLEHTCAYSGGAATGVEANGTPTYASIVSITGACFDAFGVYPALGRAIRLEDGPLVGPGNPVVVIGHRFWMRMFNGDPAAIGRTVRAEGAELTIIGVLPERFVALNIDSGMDLLTPFGAISPAPPGRSAMSVFVLGRLKPGVTFEEARERILARWPAALEASIPPAVVGAERENLLALRARVEPMSHGISFLRNDYAASVSVAVGLTAVLLLLVCVNLGGVLLARLVSRGHEVAMRLALGGSQGRIAGQVFLESLLVAGLGVLLAIPLAYAIVGSVTRLMPAGPVDRIISFTPDPTVFAVTALAGVVAALLMSGLPVWLVARRQTMVAMGAPRTIAQATGVWTRALLVGQVALSLVLLVGAGLLVRSMARLAAAPQGVRTDGLYLVQPLPVPNAYRTLDAAAYYPALVARVAAIPGVRSVALARVFPRMTIEAPLEPVAFEGEPHRDAWAAIEVASPGYFETIGVPFIAGRGFTWTDTEASGRVAIVSEGLARALAPDGAVIGRRIGFGGDPRHQQVEIVGVVRDHSLGNPRQPAVPVFYRPTLQAGRSAAGSSLVLTADAGVAGVAGPLREAVAAGGAEYVHEVVSVDAMFARAASSERISAWLAGAIAALAGLLAFLGIFGLLAYAVSRRTREIGVRVAVGAASVDIIALVLREGLLIAAAGLALGVPLAVAAGRLLEAVLFGVSAFDAATYAVASGLLLGLAALAGLVPARRATRVDAATALRSE
ncbi:MAG: ADOP family duplicated permease [Acidobacteriota bacterium]